MTIADSSAFLRRTLWLDAAVSGTTGIVMGWAPACSSLGSRCLGRSSEWQA